MRGRGSRGAGWGVPRVCGPREDRAVHSGRGCSVLPREVLSQADGLLLAQLTYSWAASGLLVCGVAGPPHTPEELQADPGAPLPHLGPHMSVPSGWRGPRAPMDTAPAK